MQKEKLEEIKNMPKVVLHLHLDGSLRPETVYNWLKQEENNVTLEEVKEKLMVDKDCSDLPLKVLQAEDHIEQATYELFEDLAKQNVIYAEVRFAPSLHTQKGLSYERVVESAIKGMNRAKKEFKIEGNLLLCCMRGEDNTLSNLTTVATAKKYLNHGVCGLDLAGAEALFPTSEFADIFKVAKEQNIPFTIHAGEAAGPESIKNGHGVRCLEDPKLVGELIEKEIPLEICPISNLQTKATGEHHPIEELYKKGIKVSINPDNDTVSNTNIIEEYKWVIEHTNLTIDDIANMNKSAIRGAFISPQEKASLIAKLNEYKKDHNKVL